MAYFMYSQQAVGRLMDMPLEYGSYKTSWRRLKRWQDEEEVWDRILKELASIREHEEVAAVDSSTVEAKKEGGEK
jgi:hypothetical protein